MLKQEISQLQQQLAAERATREAAETQLDKAHSEVISHQQAQESARRYFAEEMERLRAATQLEIERYAASERRFLQEIDRERQSALKLQKEMEQIRQETSKIQDEYRTESATSQRQMGDLRQQLGILEGRLESIGIERDQLTNELRNAQTKGAESLAKQAQLDTEIALWRQRAEAAELALAETRDKVALKSPKMSNLLNTK